jgi:hypothetical protein
MTLHENYSINNCGKNISRSILLIIKLKAFGGPIFTNLEGPTWKNFQICNEGPKNHIN